MGELFEAAASLQTLLLVLGIFGFAPGFILRILVHLYPRASTRRRELIAELYCVRRIERPLWVAEQVEVALFEGLQERVRARKVRKARTKRDKKATHRRSVRPAHFLVPGVIGMLSAPVAAGQVGQLPGSLAQVIAILIAAIGILAFSGLMTVIYGGLTFANSGGDQKVTQSARVKLTFGILILTISLYVLLVLFILLVL
jgi:hypothetical protein